MIVAGLDLALVSTGLYIRDTEEKIEKAIIIKTESKRKNKPAQFKNRFLRYSYITFSIMKELPLNCDLVAIEAYSFGSKGSAVHSMVENGYNLRLALLDNFIPFIEVAPISLKAFATGQTHSDKQRVMDAVKKEMSDVMLGELERLKKEEKNDLADAWVLAKIAFGVLNVEKIEDDSNKKGICERLSKLIYKKDADA